ncbi:MAG TPA: hypothetical protein VF214_08465 [Edaphobacter sp.]
MTGLESWLDQATRHLSMDSAAQVRAEIQEHYESAREAAFNGGATTAEADLSALTALGDAKSANCQYRRVLLTSGEARLLRQGNWEAHMFCSRARLKWLLLVPIAALFVATALWLSGVDTAAQIAFAVSLITTLLFAAPFLPIYTPSRSRVFRCVKWLAFIAIFILIFGPDTLKMSWLLISCLWPVTWVELKRVSIRRKLPVARWPKQLYL